MVAVLEELVTVKGNMQVSHSNLVLVDLVTVQQDLLHSFVHAAEVEGIGTDVLELLL